MDGILEQKKKEQLEMEEAARKAKELSVANIVEKSETKQIEQVPEVETIGGF